MAAPAWRTSSTAIASTRASHLVERQRRAVDESAARVAARAPPAIRARSAVATFICALARSISASVEPLGGLGQAVERGAHHFAGVLGGRAGVEAEQAGVGITPSGTRRSNRRGRASRAPPGTVATTCRRRPPRRRPGRRRDPSATIAGPRSRRRYASARDASRRGFRRRDRRPAPSARRRRAPKRREQRVGARDQTSRDRPRRRRRPRLADAVVASQIGVDRLAVEAAHAFARAEDRAADRLLRPGGGG